MTCKICKNTIGNKTYVVEEMMFGYRDKFIYFQCSRCDCLQILEAPQEMAKYYPENYNSCEPFSIVRLRVIVKNIAKKLRDNYIIFNKRKIIGKWISLKFPDGGVKALAGLNLRNNFRILDVGCGAGGLLYELKEVGFKDLLGVDPYISENIKYPNGLQILKGEIQQVTGRWDVVIFNHSLEHIQNPFGVLQVTSNLLFEEGVCIIRTPVVPSYFWHYYKTRWVQIDAPRHFFIYSPKSMSILAGEANLAVEKVIYDSYMFDFWGSEEYVRNIPLVSSGKYITPLRSLFSAKELRIFEQRARDLNLKHLGGQAVFYLRKKKDIRDT